jgi:hypothetical protein
MFQSALRLGGLVVLSFALVACGGDGDDDGGDTNGGGGSESTATAASGDGGGGGGDCAGTNLVFNNKTTGESVDITSTAAISLQGGAAYTAYAGDFDIDPESISLFSNPTVPADGNLIIVAITVFNATEAPAPLEPGTAIEHTTDFDVLTFVVTQTAGETLHGNGTNGAGSLTVTGVGDSLCFEVDYADDEKELSGTFEGAVKPL